MANLLRRLLRNTNKIVKTQVKNSPNFQAQAVRVTGGRAKRKPPKKLNNGGD